MRKNWRVWRKLSAIVGGTCLILAAVVLVRTALYRSERHAVESAPLVELSAGAAERLAASLRFRTISNEDPAAFDASAFAALHAHLASAFPRVQAQLQREVVASHSLLYTWRGSDPALSPIVLMGHLDVVPVEPGTEQEWRHDPFSGTIAENAVWGRGAIDNKLTVVGLLEAAEMLLAQGYRPRRTIHFAFGHDEEVGGMQGAAAIAALLRSRGVEPELVLDEGGVITDGVLPVQEPVALIGVAEKGFATIELNARGNGGHSSLPPAQSTIGILSAAIARLEAHQMPARLEGPTRQLFARVGPELPIAQRVLFANLWLTGPVVTNVLQSSPTTNAMVRTTTAVTIVEGGSKDNVLPSQARAVVNFRIRPGDSIERVLNHVREVIDDPRIEVRVAGRFSAEPSEVSSTGHAIYQRLERAIQRTSPEAIVAPYLVVVVTDSRHFQGISDNIYRFLPVLLSSDDLARIHGANERIEIDRYEHAVRSYREILVEMSGE